MQQSGAYFERTTDVVYQTGLVGTGGVLGACHRINYNGQFHNLSRCAANIVNPKSTGLFPPRAALGGVSTPSVKLDPDMLES